jgi:acetylornithine/N-succinyldiaminopimelate aminotransferase
MSDVESLTSAAQRLLLNNYRQAPIAMSHGQGSELWDTSGRRYLDMTAGVAVCVLGHADPGLANAIAEQARRLVHTSNLYYVENQLRLAEALIARGFPGGRAFF